MKWILVPLELFNMDCSISSSLRMIGLFWLLVPLIPHKMIPTWTKSFFT